MLLYTDGYVAVLSSCFVIGVVALANINENPQNPWYKCDGDNIPRLASNTHAIRSRRRVRARAHSKFSERLYREE